MFAKFFEADVDDVGKVAEAVEVVHDEDVVFVGHCGADGCAKRRDLLHGQIERVVSAA